jgi:hypothetical protein
MPIILAVEPDHKQAARLAAIVRHHVGAELVIGDTTERALDALGSRVPDMVLVPALLSPQDDASLAAALRVIAAAAHVRTLTIPVLASGKQQSAAGGLLSRWRRGRAESPETDGCDPAVFAEQITTYLKEAAAERAERDDYQASRVARIVDRPEPVRDVVPTAQALEAAEPPAFAAYKGAETFAADTFAADTFAADTFAADTFAADTFAADTFASSETPAPAAAFAAIEPFAAPRTLSAAERYAGAATYETATYDTTLSSDEQDANVDAASPVVDLSSELGSPVLDLSSELGSAAPPATDQNLYNGEPFGTYTLPPFDEVQADATASLDAPLSVDTPAVFDAPMVQSNAASPIDIDEPILLEEPFIFEPPAIFESIEFEAAESLAAAEPSVAIESPVAFQALPVHESPKVVERAGAVQPPPIEASRPAASASRSASSAAAKPKPAPVVKAPVAFERPEVLELAAPLGMSPWRAWPRIEGVPIEVPGIPAVAKADAPDWTELMASLRQDMERRRTQEHRPPATRKPRSKSEKPAVDEWGLFDPEQCGFSALLAKLDEITTA